MSGIKELSCAWYNSNYPKNILRKIIALKICFGSIKLGQNSSFPLILDGNIRYRLVTDKL